MMADVRYTSPVYCSLCDCYFPDKPARAAHVQDSVNHPGCNKCNKRFSSRNALRNHLVSSPRHNFCNSCEIEFKTPAGLRVHIDMAAVHRDDSDDDDDEDHFRVDFNRHGWEDKLGHSMYPQEIASATADENEEEDDHWEEDEQQESEGQDTSQPSLPEETYPQVLQRTESSSSLSSVFSISSSSTTSSISTPASEFVLTFYNPRAIWHRSEENTLITIVNPEIRSWDDIIKDDPFESEPVPEPEPEPAVLSSSPRTYGCPLCLEEPSADTSSLRCGHLFCTSCISTALRTKRVCPVCRARASRRHLRRTFLPLLGDAST
ncbi:hypothetical protein K474DRAFT_768234 [Panus rudis PR-1116 ss-1]|nr:hypothetical protein K474DRAFT_768234 [Panus rudis PR-1116 ss-1]